jgi:hypothetical protein
MENLDKIILIFALGILGIIASTVLVKVISKLKKNVQGILKHGKSEVSLRISEENNNEEKHESHLANQIKVPTLTQDDLNFDLDKLSLHRFFTTVLCQYTSDNCMFNLYDETIRLGIISDSPEVADFKKLLASKYLHACLFRVLGEHVKQWIDDLVVETKRVGISNKKIPSTFFSISQYVTKYKIEAYKEGKTIEFKFNDKVIYGIPTRFMSRFNEWSDSKMVRVYNMISDVLYSTQNTWFAKTIELLDLFEVIFIMLHDQMDSTLIILNGEISQYLKNMNEDK